MMMIMFLMMIVGIAVVIALGFFAFMFSTEVAKRKRQEEDFSDEVMEKAKRGRVRLSDDGELVDIADTDPQADEQWKRRY